MTTENFVIRAGRNAFDSIQESGFSPDRVKVIAGAAGGPKWLPLSHLDRLMFSNWFQSRSEPVDLIGSSIGAWRFAALSQSQPVRALESLEKRYISQQYDGRPTPDEVSREGDEILRSFVSDQGVQEIVNNPVIKLNIFTVRCKGLASSDNPVALIAGLAIAAGINALSRKGLESVFERVLFQAPDSRLTLGNHSTFRLKKIELTTDNLKTALNASGSIPTVMNGVRFNDDRLPGTYRDGGLLEYHLDIPYNMKAPDDIVLFPHFAERVVPGWLDKKLKWRKPDPDNMKNVLMITPSPAFIDTLPLKKIPDRKDFKLFFGKDAERIQYWKEVVNRSSIFANSVFETLESSRIRKLIQPM